MAKQSSSKHKKEQKPAPFNPLSWGMLFFVFWLSIQAFDELSFQQQCFGWFFLGLSALLFCSIFVPFLQRILTSRGWVGLFVSLVFFTSLMGFSFSLVQGWADLKGGSYLMYIAVIGGNLWFIAFFVVLARIFAEFEKPGRLCGIGYCIITIAIGIYNAIASNVLAGTIIAALGLLSILIIIKRLPIWHELPFLSQ